MRIESGEGSSGGTMKGKTDIEMEKKISEWVVNLSLGEEEEAESYVTNDERAALVSELATMTDPMERREREEEQKLAWKLRMKREKKRSREEVSKMTAEVAKVQACRQEVLAQPDDKAKWDKVLGYLEVLSKAWMEERQASWSQDVALSATRSGFRDFAREIVTHIGGEVKQLRDNVGKFCEGAIQGAEAVAVVEGEARPRKDPVKLKFPDAYGGKKEENFDNWEASVNSYIYLQHILNEEQVLVAFQALKDEAASFARSLVRTVDPSLRFVVTTDASQYGIGAVLQQDDDNGYRPVEFMSARMPCEKVANSTYERELYALRQTLDHWKHYLLGRHFKVYSDHETLRWLKTRAKMTPKLTRWAAEIDQFDFELKPMKGKYNVGADALSRRSDYFGAVVHYLDIGRDLQEKVKQVYAHDPIYSDLLKRVREALETEPDYRTTYGLLFEKTNVFDRLCVPNNEEIRSLILGECHDTEGHFGWQKTLANLMRAYTWPGMKNDCIEYVSSCKVCQRNKSTTRAPLGLLRPLPILDQPGDSVSIDFMDTQVKSRHAGLAGRDVFLGENGGDDGVVGANGEVLPVEVRAPDLEGMDYGEEFLLVGGVIHLRGKELLACEGDGVFTGWGLRVGGGVFDGGGFRGVARKMLREDGSNDEVECVSGNVEMSRGVGDLVDGGRGDGLFEEVEGVLVAVVPIEGLVLACEFVEWVRDVGEVADEGAIIVGKAEE
uniref:Integrase catalytic domain-containing protein n=1 Tax=Chara braunii TaxID=69332 RepID=A0A388M6X2_CHABU